jgi:hypothetical protein
MKKAITFLALTLAGVCLVVAAYFCHFYYSRYQSAVTELEGRINSFDLRLASLEGHKSRELTPVQVWGMILTSDRPPDEHMQLYLSSEKHPDGYFEAVNAKGGALIRPEIRLSTNPATNSEYDVHIDSQFGIVAGAWLSHAEPYQDLAAFEEFLIYCPPNKTNMVRLIARAKPGASVKMRFDIVILCEQ